MTELTHLSFGDFVRSHRLAVVHFWATWNKHDIEMKRFLESEIGAEFTSQIVIGRMDVDPPEHHAICREHKFMNIPALVFYRDGSLVATLVGQNRALILQRMAELVAVSS